MAHTLLHVTLRLPHGGRELRLALSKLSKALRPLRNFADAVQISPCSWHAFFKALNPTLRAIEDEFTTPRASQLTARLEAGSSRASQLTARLEAGSSRASQLTARLEAGSSRASQLTARLEA